MQNTLYKVHYKWPQKYRLWDPETSDGGTVGTCTEVSLKDPSLWIALQKESKTSTYSCLRRNYGRTVSTSEKGLFCPQHNSMAYSLSESRTSCLLYIHPSAKWKKSLRKKNNTIARDCISSRQTKCCYTETQNCKSDWKEKKKVTKKFWVVLVTLWYLSLSEFYQGRFFIP